MSTQTRSSSDKDVKKPAVATTGSDFSDAKPTQDGMAIEDPETGEIRRVSASFIIDNEAERRLVWKFDLRILPTLAFMYLCNSLDKGNLGQSPIDCSPSHR